MSENPIDKLKSERQRIAAMGGEDALARQRKKGKLDVRKRLELFFDDGRFTEIGAHVDHSGRDRRMKGRQMAADGVVTGVGLVGGARTYVIAYDFTVLGGSMGYHGEKKAARIREMAAETPGNLVWMIDSAGARVGELGGSFFSTMGDLFYEQVRLSGNGPQLCLVFGPGVAGTAYIPGLADCVIMTRENSFLALAGPPLVEAAISEKVSEEELGGAQVHYYFSGLCHMLADDDDHALKLGRHYLSFFHEEAPVAGQTFKGEKEAAELNRLMPADPHTPFDINEVLDRVSDKGSRLEFGGGYGRSLVTSFARVGGFSAGIIANQSTEFGGIITNEAAQKAARFIQICDSHGIPLIFLHDVPGFMVGSRVEKQGIIRDGAKFLFAMANCRVPRIALIVRKSYGAGYFVMSGRGFKPDAIACWPSAEIALMGAEGVVNIIFRKEVEAAEDPEKKKAELIAAIKDEISAFRSASLFGVDDIIEPAESRQYLIDALRLSEPKARRARQSTERRVVFPV